MSPIEKLKAEAVALRKEAKASGYLMRHSEALEQIAKNHGYGNWRACAAALAESLPTLASPGAEKAQPNNSETKRYRSSEWHFALDIPKGWNSFPPVATNSPYEVIRFWSYEGGTHLLIIFRQPRDSKRSLEEHTDQVEQILAKNGFANFAAAETTVASRAAMTLTFDKPHQEEETWSCRHYHVPDGTLIFTLGFGTTRRAEMFEIFDRIAKSFEILAD